MDDYHSPSEPGFNTLKSYGVFMMQPIMKQTVAVRWCYRLTTQIPLQVGYHGYNNKPSLNHINFYVTIEKKNYVV